jgi:hypothetical protein
MPPMVSQFLVPVAHEGDLSPLFKDFLRPAYLPNRAERFRSRQHDCRHARWRVTGSKGRRSGSARSGFHGRAA